MSAPQFEGKTIVVTGAAGGIGRAIVNLLHKLEARTVGVDLHPSEADVSLEIDLSDVETYWKIEQAIGHDCLVGVVNGAATNTNIPSDEVDVDCWDRLMAVNLRAPFYLGELLVSRLHESEGTVLNIASVHAFATSPGVVPYAASKGGLVALTRAQAVDWSARGFNVRSNSIVLGATDSAMLRVGLDRMGLDLDTMRERHLTRRLCKPDELATLVALLMGKEFSFMNGACFTLDGGALAQLSTEVDWGRGSRFDSGR